MDNLMDIIWFKIVAGVQYIKEFVDILTSPLNQLGPVTTILIMALVTVVITKSLTRVFKTKRYKQLQKEFRYWYNLRQEALKCEDPEKAKLLAKNIDQAKLNKVYYDYFFEGFLNSLATKYLPILVVLAYVNQAYHPVNLLKLFGREYIFKFARSGSDPILVGSVFWFILSILLVHLTWYLIKIIYRRMPFSQNQSASTSSSAMA
jgi:uncharacterized membrane protein (DUF106 family)